MNAELIDVMGGDLMVANVARVSMDKHHEVFEESDAKLIRYLARSDHWSPFSHPKIQVRLELPTFVARQWEKHRIGCVRGYDIYDQNEVSRRYVSDTPTFFIPEVWRSKPDGSIKQGSGGPVNSVTQYKAELMYEKALKQCEDAYRAFLAWGIAPEQARIVLPQSMNTSWIETGSLSYWARVYNLRVDAHAQKEIQDLAQQVGGLIEPLFPVSWQALTERTEA